MDKVYYCSIRITKILIVFLPHSTLQELSHLAMLILVKEVVRYSSPVGVALGMRTTFLTAVSAPTYPATIAEDMKMMQECGVQVHVVMSVRHRKNVIMK